MIIDFGGEIGFFCNQIVASDIGTVLGTTIGGSLGSLEETWFGIS